MGFTPEQIKGRIKSVAKQNNADARTLMRIYMMERFLERLAQSEYRDNFIIKGGILVTAMIGVAHRSTMDIDTSMKNLNLSAEDALRVVNQVKDIDLDDGVSFDVKDVSNIMDEMEYPGIRVTMNANVGRLITPLKIDISTGDVITPRAIEFNYDLLLEDRSISLWSYNLETILAEKLQTVLARGILNTRMRDFYDIRMLLDTYEDKVNKAVLKDAFAATCKKRGTDHLQEQAEEIIKIIEADEQLQLLWRAYQKKYSYAAEIDYASVIRDVRKLMDGKILFGEMTFFHWSGCEKGNPNAIHWGRLKEGRWCASTLGCRGQAKTLFDIMEWEEGLKYRFRGQFVEQGDNKLMLFELDEPEMIKIEEIVLPSKEEEAEGKTVKQMIYIFPPEWAGTFGQPITSIAQVGILQQEHYAGNWDVLRPAAEIKEMNTFTADGLNKLLHEAEEIMEGWTDTNE